MASLELAAEVAEALEPLAHGVHAALEALLHGAEAALEAVAHALAHPAHPLLHPAEQVLDPVQHETALLAAACKFGKQSLHCDFEECNY